jgi:hypothetical protein
MRDRSLRSLAILFLVTSVFVLPYLRGDGNGYYAWLRSPVIDHDLQFRDEFAHGDPAFLATVFDANGNLLPGMSTETDHVRNQWSVGPAVAWALPFLVADIVVLLARALGAHWPADGFSTPYLWLVGWSSALYSSVGLLIAAAIARRFFRQGPVIAGTLAIWLASSLPIYQYFLAFFPFAVGVLAAAGLLLVWLRDGWAWRRWLPIGLLGGFLVSVHPIGVAWLALPAVSLLGLERGSIAERAKAAAFAGAGAIIALLPELIGKAIVNGSPFDTGYQAQWDFLHPHLLRVLVGAEHGLLSWTPVLAVALVGLALVWRRADRRLGIGLVVVFGVMLFIVGAYGTSEQSSYGNRFFVLFTPGFVIGAVAVADALWSRRSLVVGAIGVLMVWNVLFMFQWAWGLVPKRGPVDWSTMARQQFTEAPRELVHAVRLFFTDRGELIRIVQDRDLEQTRSGQDTAGGR